MESGTGNLEQAAVSELIQAISMKLREVYVFPEMAERICLRLQDCLKDEECASISAGKTLAYLLNLYLQDASHDEHLWVRWHKEPLPPDDGPLRLNPAWQEERRLEARLENYGLVRVERLPGHVGYLEIRYFHRPEWGGETASAALNFLAGTQALLIDLRRCEGGYPGMAALVSSYLLGQEPVLLERIEWRDDGTTQEFWTVGDIPGRRFGDGPVYILTSAQTFSAAEGFAYNLQARRRALVIGEKTGGGAHPGASYRIHPHFELFIPIGKVTNAFTGTDWEGRGVIPDVPVPREKAFPTAYRLALASILAKCGESIYGPFQRLEDEAREELRKISQD